MKGARVRMTPIWLKGGRPPGEEGGLVPDHGLERGHGARRQHEAGGTGFDGNAHRPWRRLEGNLEGRGVGTCPRSREEAGFTVSPSARSGRSSDGTGIGRAVDGATTKGDGKSSSSRGGRG